MVETGGGAVSVRAKPVARVFSVLKRRKTAHGLQPAGRGENKNGRPKGGRENEEEWESAVGSATLFASAATAGGRAAGRVASAAVLILRAHCIADDLGELLLRLLLLLDLLERGNLRRGENALGLSDRRWSDRGGATPAT